MVLPIKFRSGSPSCYCVKVDFRTEFFFAGLCKTFLVWGWLCATNGCTFSIEGYDLLQSISELACCLCFRLTSFT